MQYLKKFVLFILMLFCICLPCENYQSYLSSFDDAFKTDFYCPDVEYYDTMLSQISKVAEKHHVLVYKVYNISYTMFFSEVQIYADQEATDYLEQVYDVHAGTFNSLISGKTDVKFYSFFDIPVKIREEKIRISVIGNQADMDAFKSDLIEKYGGDYPKNDGFDAKKNSRFLLWTIWFLTAIMICFFTFYETMMMKKENFIRITLGESLFLLWVRFVLFDILFIGTIFAGCIWIACILYSRIFMLKEMLILLSILILADMLISTNLLFYQRNKVLAHLSLSRKMLTINNSVKCVAIILIVISVSTSLSVIYEYYQYVQQKPFYEQYADYCVLQNIIARNNNEDPYIQFLYEGEFYRNYVKKANITLIEEGVTLPSGKNTILANHNAVVSYIENEILELQDCTFDKDIYIIYYENNPPTPEEKKILLSENDGCTVDEIVYHTPANLVMRTPEEKFTKWAKNPIIIYYNTDLAERYYDDPMQIELVTPIIFSIIAENGSVEEYMNAHDIDFSSTNMMDYFEHESLKLKKTAYLSTVLAVILLILQIMILLSIIRLEYTVNAIELSIKKVIGYSILERFYRQYLLSFFLYMFSMLAAILISKKLQFGDTSFILYGIFLMYLIETLLFTIFAKRYERNNIQKILKGGAL